MRYIGLACLFILTFAGCATSPPIPSFETKRGDRVGVLVDVGDGLVHTHIGTMVFNNFEKEIPVPVESRLGCRRDVEELLFQVGFCGR